MKSILSLVLMLFAHSLFAADIQFVASASRTQVAVGEIFEVTFTVNGQMQRFTPPAFNSFQLAGGPNQSSSMTSVNGATSVSMSLGYDLVATREGNFTIGPATVMIDGKQYRSNSIRIKVVGKTASASNNQANGNPAGNSTGSPPIDITKRLFIKAAADKTNVYQGEQLAVTYKLYTNIDIVDNGVDKLPEFNGFWSQEIKMNTQNIEWTTEIYNGVRYNVAALKKVILFPERFGKLKLDPLGMTFVVRQTVPSNDPIEQFFGGAVKDVKYQVKSSPLTINVKPLPEVGRPADFNGAVGRFSINATADKTSLRANEAVNYNIRITGTGNLKLFKAPEVTVASDIEKYDPKITDNITETLSGASGSRDYGFLLIPRHEGNYQLAPLKFSYFNPSSGRYVSLATEGFELKVAKGAPGSNVAAVTGLQTDIKELDKDIRYIKSNINLSKDEQGFYGSGSFYALLVSGPLFFLAAIIFRNRYRAQNKDASKVKNRNAGKVAAKHMANAQRQLLNGDEKVFYEAVYKGLLGYLSDKFGIQAADLNKENIAQQLALRNISQPVISQLIETIGLCEMARYAPVSGISEADVFEKSKGIINSIENA
ncbi:MAG: BatD family protein [Bacteroidota bacterium]